MKATRAPPHVTPRARTRARKRESGAEPQALLHKTPNGGSSANRCTSSLHCSNSTEPSRGASDRESRVAIPTIRREGGSWSNFVVGFVTATRGGVSWGLASRDLAPHGGERDFAPCSRDDRSFATRSSEDRAVRFALWAFFCGELGGFSLCGGCSLWKATPTPTRQPESKWEEKRERVK